MRLFVELLLERPNRTEKEYYINNKINLCTETNYERGLTIIRILGKQEEESNARAVHREIRYLGQYQNASKKLLIHDYSYGHLNQFHLDSSCGVSTVINSVIYRTGITVRDSALYRM